MGEEGTRTLCLCMGALSWVAARVCPPSGPLYMYRARSVAKDVAVWTYMALLVLLALLAPLWPPAITPLQRTLGDPAHFSHDFNRSIVSMGFLKVGGAPCCWGGGAVPSARPSELCVVFVCASSCGVSCHPCGTVGI